MHLEEYTTFTFIKYIFVFASGYSVLIYLSFTTGIQALSMS